MADQPASLETTEARLARIEATLRSIDDLGARVAFLQRQLTITAIRASVLIAVAIGSVE
jgi:hypothetical protein